MSGRIPTLASLALCLSALVLLPPAFVSADIIYAGPPGGQTYQYVTGGTVGTEFTSNISADVVRLGISVVNGLSESHEVALWDVAANAWIADTTIQAGSVAEANGYAWEDVTAQIVAGDQYIVAAFYQDGADFFGTTANIDPAFTLTNDLYVDGSSFQLPNAGFFNDGVQGWFGPNVQVSQDTSANSSTGSVPEPGSIVIWSLLGLAIGGVRSRRHRLAA
jgi:hypothetical protein